RFNIPTMPALPSLDGGLYFPSIDASFYLPSSSARFGDLWARVAHRAESTKLHAEYMLKQDGGRRRVDYQGVAGDAEAVSNAALIEDCAGARVAMNRLKGRMRADGAVLDEIGRVEAQTLERVLNAYCTEIAKARAPEAGTQAEAGRAAAVTMDAG